MKSWTTVLAGALILGLAGAPMGVYADHHEGGPGDSDGSVSEAAAKMEGEAEASATDAAEKMEGEAKEAMDEVGDSEGSH